MHSARKITRGDARCITLVLCMEKERPRREPRVRLPDTAAKIVKDLMEAQGKTRKMLMARWEESEPNVSRWLSGQVKMPARYLDDLAAWLGTERGVFLRGVPQGRRQEVEETVLVPGIARGIAERNGGGYRGEAEEWEMPIPLRYARGKKLGAIEVIGECLSPDLEPGQFAIISKHQWMPHQIVAVELLATQECLLKRATIEDGHIRLSTNAGEGDLYAPDQIDILGPVIGVFIPWGSW